MTYGFSFLHGSVSWRFPIAFQLLFSIVLYLTVPWLPESPRWLLAHGREEEGTAVLAALEGNGAETSDPVVQQQKDEILEAVNLERASAQSWSDILKGKTGDTGMMQRLMLGAGEDFISLQIPEVTEF